MMRATGCDGVVVGRGCLGRPWLFRDLADLFAGREPADPPRLGEIVSIALRHARGLVAHFGEGSGIQQFRKWGAWYTKAFPASAALRDRLMRVERFSDVESILSGLDAGVPFPPAGVRAKRGKHSGRPVVSLPPGYLARLDDAEPPSACVDDLVAAEGG
jgi:tRNA-dihydrouridine synthase